MKKRWMKYFLFLIVISCTTSLFGQKDQLIVWKNEAKPVLKIEDIEKIKTLAIENGLAFIIKEANEGIPKEINSTPAIVFQNANGRSFYYGRYKNISRLQNFIRASRLAHQEPISNFKKEILVWEEGKTKVMAPLKLTELKGELPKQYVEAVFIVDAKGQIQAGMKSFRLKHNFESNSRTRSFYFNLYPYVDEDANLTIGAEIFSQYNCVKPVFRQFETGLVTGKWKNRNRLFKDAGGLIEEQIFKIMAESENGDAMQSIPESLAQKSWEQLDCALPILKQQTTNGSEPLPTLPDNWEVELPKDKNEPFCIFSFLAPLDSYAGEVKDMTGSFSLANENELSSATGKFEVQIADVTMGSDDFDYEVHNKMLNKKDFPNSTFEFDTFDVNEADIKLGNSTDFVAKGKFKLLGRTIQLFANGQIMPYKTENEELRLQVNCTFNLPLFESFRVEGPDGPSPAKDTLRYFMKFNLKPVKG